MHAFGKIRGLVIYDWYFSWRMEIISTEKKGNKRKGCRNIVQNLCVAASMVAEGARSLAGSDLLEV